MASSLNPAKTSKPNFESIQVLRAIAAMLVVLFHMHLLDFGFTGVDLFFVISGFIMGTIGLKEQPADFLFRRIIRIVPLYWLMTLAMCALSLVPGLMRNFQFTIPELLLSLFFIPYSDSAGNIWPLLVPGWTLNFEMFFYLVFAVCLAIRMPRLGTGIVMLTLVTVGALWPNPDPRYTVITSPLILEFAAGLMLSRIGTRIPAWAGAVLLIAGTLWFSAMLASAQPPGEGFLRLINVGLPSTLIVAGVLAVETKGFWLAMPPLRYLGDISYSLYLTHGMAISFVHKVTQASPVLTVPISLVASIAVAAVTYRFVEKPSLKWLNAMRAKVRQRQFAQA